MKTDVYRNLNKPGVIFSIRQRGKVIGWERWVGLRNVTAKHPSPSQLAAVRNGPRQVCAWLKGDLVPFDSSLCKEGILLQFDPKKDDRFPFDHAEWVMFTPNGIFYNKPKP